MHSFALGVSRLGGAALLFHWPGHGDSHGDLDTVAIADLTRASIDARTVAAERLPGVPWNLAGFRLGAAVALLTAQLVSIPSLLLVQPVFDPEAFFAEAARIMRRASLVGGGRPEDELDGVPGSRAWAGTSAEVMSALRAYKGRVGIAACATPPLDAHIDPGSVLIARSDWRRELREGGRRLVPIALRAAQALAAP